ncbi:choice-of-anchor I family protein [Microbacterium koreense]|uniref:Choice-of-anchor I family protein n=1 Tax=Microbacterium koreense TaxID=323761 RepID=A0ABW2ZNG6_9MICO
MTPRIPRRRRAAALALTAATALAVPFLAAPAAQAGIVDEPIVHSAEDAPLGLSPIGTYETGVFDESAAEIVQVHGDRLYVVNALAGVVDVLDIADPANPVKLFELEATGTANSLAIREDGLGVVAFENPTKTEPGSLVFFDADAAAPALLGSVTVGALPDNVVISHDGAYAVVANEGEPDDDFAVDPEGSVGVVTLPEDKAAPSQDAVRTADFHAFEAGGTKTLHPDVRVFGPQPHGDDLRVSRNLEPEYIAVDGNTAYAALQEANAVAVVDLVSATVTDIWPLGFKDHSLEGFGIDPSDRDPRDAPEFDIRTYEGLSGMYMPDGIASYEADGATYLVTANEGDAREWGDYVEPARVKDLEDDGYGEVCADSAAADYLEDEDLGRLSVSIEEGFNEALGCYEELYAFGSRSFSIWTTTGEQVFDSGEAFEQITHAAAPDFFNSNHSESNLEGRSEDKGPEPENLAVGQVGDRTYAFVGFERVGGIAVFDITEPAASAFVTYVNNRDFSVSMEDAIDDYEPENAEHRATLSQAGDLGPEGVAFIPAAQSPNGAPLLAVGNEVSGTTTIFEIADLTPDTVKPQTTLVAPTTEGPAPKLDIQVDATDDRGLNRVVANIYQDGVLVKSTQTRADGATSATHTASVTLPSGDYIVKYNAQDLAGNVAQTRTFAFTIDATAPKATIKSGERYTVQTGESYDLISFKLFDAQKIDKVELNGKVKNLTDNTWSDVNFIKPGTFGAAQGENTLVVFDVAGNTETYTFTLN